MIKQILAIFSCIAIISNVSAQKAVTKAPPASTSQGYNITVTITPMKNCWVHMGCYYGKNKNMVDSAWVDENSKMTFKGATKLPQGIYFTFIQRKSILFEFLMDEKQNFTMKTDTTNLEKVVVTGSEDNTIFRDYSNYLATKVPYLNELQVKYQSETNAEAKEKIRTEVIAKNKELSDYRDNVIKTQPNSMMATYFQYIKYPEAPEMAKRADGTLDSLYPARYVKEHFWDGVAFNDDKLLYTPFFDGKIDEYFKYYVVPVADSIIPEVNYMLLSARSGKEMYKYLLGKFTDKYINPEIMGQDKVFIYLFNNFFAKGDTSLYNPKQREIIFNRAYSMMANQIGDQAPALDLIDTAGNKVPMYNINAPFTFIVFWDPNCGHCKTEIPRLDSLYEAKWHAMGVKIYAVNVDEKSIPAWKTYIKEHKLNVDGWVHAYQTKEDRESDMQAQRANYRQLYDVFQTPTMFLLDKEKRIIAKKLSIEQFDQVMQAKLSTGNSAR